MLLALVLAATAQAAETEIFRCTLEDGSIAFQELPCATAADASPSEENEVQEAPGPQDDFFDFVNPFDEPEAEPLAETAPEPADSGPLSDDRAACEKAARDAIDAIDLEMRTRSYSRDEGQAYLAELRVLTSQLRACKRI